MSLEIDPADYTIYKGWGVFIGFRSSVIPHWRFRIGGGAANLLNSAVETNDNNKGWKMRLDPVFTLAGHWYPSIKRTAFFVGPFIGASQITFTSPDGGKIAINNAFAGFDVGYRWFPFKKIGLVITPHLGVLVPFYKSSKPIVGTQTYDLLPVSPLPQLLIGYEFGFKKK